MSLHNIYNIETCIGRQGLLQWELQLPRQSETQFYRMFPFLDSCHSPLSINKEIEEENESSIILCS
jgi:hypothetical protein